MTATGVSVEARIASVYEAGVVARSLALGRKVAFFAIEGPLAPGLRSARAVAAIAESTFGVDRESVRVCIETASMSFALNARRVDLAAMQSILELDLTPMRLQLVPLRIMEPAARRKKASGGDDPKSFPIRV